LRRYIYLKLDKLLKRHGSKIITAKTIDIFQNTTYIYYVDCHLLTTPIA